MARTVTATVFWRGGMWRARVTMPDGTRPTFELEGVPQHDEPRARQLAALMAKRAKQTGAVPTSRDETVNEYLERWVAWRTRRGLTSAKKDFSVLTKHFAERHGHLPMCVVTKEMLEDFVSELDEKVRTAPKFSWKSALNTWGSLAAMFRDASGAKDRVFRVLPTNPAADVAPPDKGSKRAKTYAYPNEFLALLRAADVPVERKRLYAVTTYMKLRAGELAALEWADVDLAHGTMLVHQALDRSKGGGTKATKTDRARRIRIEPALLPLLVAMQKEAATARVFPVMPAKGDRGFANILRADLQAAGCDRAELYIASKTRKAMTFHDLRATGLTWMAVRGDDALKIQATAGHAAFSTTQEYIREAEIHRDGFGEVFPALPLGLLGVEDESSPIVPSVPGKTAFIEESGSDCRTRNAGADCSEPSESAEEPPPSEPGIVRGIAASLGFPDGPLGRAADGFTVLTLTSSFEDRLWAEDLLGGRGYDS